MIFGFFVFMVILVLVVIAIDLFPPKGPDAFA